MKKRPKHELQPSTAKKATHAPREDAEHKTLVWSLQLFDKQEWYDESYKHAPFVDIAAHMRAYETRTWADIKSSSFRDHSVATKKLIPKARKRLQELRLDDLDELWRLRFTGKVRIWGIRMGREFRVLWWDPQHNICPAPKKHT